MGVAPEDGAWNVECKTHGLLPVAENREACAVVVADHWLKIHGPSAAIEGRDWFAYPALHRCDACGVPVELPAWSHTSINGPLGLEDFVDSDGEWLLCDTCHAHFEAGRLGAWVRHWFQVSSTLTKYDDDPEVVLMVRFEVAQRFRALLVNLDAGVRYP